MHSCALILLAAGASTRMGRPKQLLPINGKPLLRHVVESALVEAVSPVIVVLGANAAQIAPCLDGLRVRIVVNENWAEGMGSSIRRGLEALTESAPSVERAIFALADQPDLPPSHLAALIGTQRHTAKSIIASECDGVRGPPVLFTAKHFPPLRALRGDAGARALLQSHPDEVASVTLASARDLDTPSDYATYTKSIFPRRAQSDADKGSGRAD